MRYRLPVPSRFLASLLLALAATPAGAAEPESLQAAEPVASGSGPLEAATSVELLRPADGRDGAAGVFVPAKRLEAGDEVYYTIRVTNPGRTAVRDVVVTKLMPFGVSFTPGSAVGPDCETQFSADGGKSFATADELRIPVFGARPRKAEPADYTHLRWVLRRPLAPGATAILRFRATFS